MTSLEFREENEGSASMMAEPHSPRRLTAHIEAKLDEIFKDSKIPTADVATAAFPYSIRPLHSFRAHSTALRYLCPSPSNLSIFATLAAKV
jgi:hypothetical protein